MSINRVLLASGDWPWSRKKLEFRPIDERFSLAERFSKATSDPFILAIMDKDRRLIEAALAGEKRVASLDDRVREHIRSHREALPEVRTICWVNPDKSFESVCQWLRAGAPTDRRLTLGHLAPNGEK